MNTTSTHIKPARMHIHLFIRTKTLVDCIHLCRHVKLDAVHILRHTHKGGQWSAALNYRVQQTGCLRDGVSFLQAFLSAKFFFAL